MLNWFRLKACAKCGGDLAPDEGDWICLQCGTYDYTGLYPIHSLLPKPHPNPPPGRKSWPAVQPRTVSGGPVGAGGQYAAPPVLAATLR